MLTTPDSAGAELREWRQRHALTLADLADYLGVHWITVQRWEVGRIDVPPYLYLAIREVERQVHQQSARAVEEEEATL